MDNCVFYGHEVIFIVYMDRKMFSSPSDAQIGQVIRDIGANIDIEYQGTLGNYIKVNIESLPERKINLLQPHLVY